MVAKKALKLVALWAGAKAESLVGLMAEHLVGW